MMKRKALISAVALVAVLGGSMMAVAAGRHKDGNRMGGSGPNFERGVGGQFGGVEALKFVFDEVDANRDGKISTEEFDAYKAVQFAKIDTDESGTVSVEELAAHQEVRRLEGQKQRAEAMITMRDTDADGVLSAKELTNQPQLSQFDRLDRDRDGALSRNEFQSQPRLGPQGQMGQVTGKFGRGMNQGMGPQVQGQPMKQPRVDAPAEN